MSVKYVCKIYLLSVVLGDNKNPEKNKQKYKYMYKEYNIININMLKGMLIFHR